jgi:transposase-like protein
MSEPNSTKKCCKCKSTKLLSEFHKGPSVPDKRQYDCKECNSEYARSENAKRSKIKYRKTDAGKLSLANQAVKYRLKSKAKTKTQNAVNTEIFSGRLIRSDNCEECSSTGTIDGHHDDYAFPLVVRWLCRKCHKAWHTENGQGLNS